MKNILFIFLSLFFSFGLNGQNAPLDDITHRTIVAQKRPLAYTPLDERDLFWENRVWRVIDTRERMNLPFMNPERPLFDILVAAAKEEKIKLYDAENDSFSTPMSHEEINSVLSDIDTVEVYTEAGTYELKAVENILFYEDIKRFRVKEIWYFDSQASIMRVRILGIAPMREVYDDNGNFKYEKPLFWVHYPSSRDVLAKELVYNQGNQAARTTWEDLFERRQFASYIYKQSDVLNRRLADIYTGVEMLLEGDKIKNEIFNYEMDFWSK